MESLLECTEIDGQELLRQDLVHAIEVLALRDPAAWETLKSISGIDGLLTLMRAGNHALQISSCASVVSEAAGNFTYIEALLDRQVLESTVVLLQSEMVNVRFSALSLVKVVATIKRGRAAIMDNPNYMCLLGNLLNSGDDLEIVQAVCEVMISDLT